MVIPPGDRASPMRPFLIGLLIFAVGLAGALWWEDYQRQFVYAVEIDGSFVGCVGTKEEWRLAVQECRGLAEAAMGVPVALRSDMELTRKRLTPDDVVLSGPDLVEAAAARLVFVTDVWAISVDGVDVAYVRTESEARRVIPSIIQDYRQTLLARGNTTVLEIVVAEEVTCHRAEAPIDKVGDAEQAKRVLLRGTDRVKVHVVKSGENLWSIANSNSLTVDDLRRANPNLQNLNMIKVGQEINLIVPDPYLTIHSKERYVYISYLPFSETVKSDSSLWPWESYVEKAGVHGRKEVTVSIDRTNGNETGRQVLAERLLSSSSSQSYVLGTKKNPTSAVGLVWPAQGRITSPFGWRRREFHRGVDIGAPYGAPVYACKGGTVAFAAWNGGYGRLVIIDHGGGMESYYAHLSSIAVSVGQTVGMGDCLGYVGNTGRSTGAHLHFEIRIDGEAQNPIGYYPHGG